MRRIFFIFFFVIGLGTIAKADLATDLLQASDRGRGGLDQGLVWSLKIDTTEDGDSSVREFTVKAKGNNAYVEATRPARSKGEVFIFNDRTMWFYKPSLRKPVSISSRQKLTGQAANGDIASTHYARDYSPKILGQEVVNGIKMYKLLLTAKANNLTYDKINYWIAADTRLAMKAEFLNLQGSPIKVGILEYKNKMIVNGKSFPFVSSIQITDAKFPQNKSIMHYGQPKNESMDASLFNVNNLSR